MVVLPRRSFGYENCTVRIHIHSSTILCRSLMNTCNSIAGEDSLNKMEVFQVKVENNAVGKDSGKVSKHAVEEKVRGEGRGGGRGEEEGGGRGGGSGEGRGRRMGRVCGEEKKEERGEGKVRALEVGEREECVFQ